ncbi:MAG: NAD(+) synthase [Phycisphaerae bacterium]|nr:NAD(+) synthase [Phycisphaerae bacterium]
MGPTQPNGFGANALAIDCASVTRQVSQSLREATARRLRRRGLLVAVSGGVDSAVCAALAVRAVGAERVFGLLLPDRDSTDSATQLGRQVCETLGMEYRIEDISPMLDAAGCYRRRHEAVRRIFPDFAENGRMKIVMSSSPLHSEQVNFFELVAEMPDGTQKRRRMPLDVYLQVVAATNMKQRTRKLMEYYHAERLNYAVVGTPNRLEYELGFFVRGGDGLADVKPIAHLYKTQVYALARYLGVAEEICCRPPSTETYSLPQTQEEFYFAVPYAQMDLLLYALSHGVSARDAAAATRLSEDQAERVFRDILAKRRIAAQLRQPAILMDEVDLDSSAPVPPAAAMSCVAPDDPGTPDGTPAEGV